MGLTQSVITPFSSSILNDLFPSNLKGAAFSVFNIGTYISFSLSLSLGLYIYDQYGWQAGYIIFGVIGLMFACFLPLLRFALPNHSSSYSDSKTVVSENEQEDSRKLPTFPRSLGDIQYSKVEKTESPSESWIKNPIIIADESEEPAAEPFLNSTPKENIISTMMLTFKDIVGNHWFVSQSPL